MEFHIGPYFETLIDWLTDNFEPFFDGIKVVVLFLIEGIEKILIITPSFVIMILFALLAWKLVSKGVALFTLGGLFFIYVMQLWTLTMQTLAMVITSGFIALVIGIPVGILASRSDRLNSILRPVLDFMQTMPAFVYLIPAVIFFGLGKVPGAIATVIFSMPPVIRLTNLGIRQVPEDVVEASRSFGSTPSQLLFKVQLPLATPTILAGVNQTIMLALSMVVIASMIGSSGLGNVVLSGITQLKIGRGFEGGIAVVILAIILDRITQSLGKTK